MKKLILSVALSAFALSMVAAEGDAAKDATCPAKGDKTVCPAGKDAAGCCKDKAAAGCCKDKADAAKPADTAKK